MNINDILRAFRGSAKIVAPINEENFPQRMGASYIEFRNFIEQHGLTMDKFHLTDSVMNNTFYIDYENGVYIDCYNLSKESFEFMQFLKRLEQLSKKQKMLLTNEDYTHFYMMIPEALRVYDFSRRYLNINTDKISDVWLDIYISIDYGFEIWDKEILEYVFKYRHKVNGKRPITIYRGIGTKSTSLDNAYSWTKDINTALFFATKNGEGKALAKAKVNPEDIIFYTNERYEKEVIVRYEDLKDVTFLDLLECNMNYLRLICQDYYADYIKYGKNIKKNWFTYDDHDYSHSARVLFYSLMLSDNLNLSISEKQILAYCSILHDIGRVNDGVDSTHGKLAINTVNEQKIELSNIHLNDENLYVAHKIIELHCIDDETGLNKIISDPAIANKEKAIRLYNIFKDADCLDRVRFGYYRYDFDITYLRLEESKKLLFLVAGLHYYKVESLLNSD